MHGWPMYKNKFMLIFSSFKNRRACNIQYQNTMLNFVSIYTGNPEPATRKKNKKL